MLYTFYDTDTPVLEFVSWKFISVTNVTNWLKALAKQTWEIYIPKAVVKWDPEPSSKGSKKKKKKQKKKKKKNISKSLKHCCQLL